jgi:hypothetical protein
LVKPIPAAYQDDAQALQFAVRPEGTVAVALTALAVFRGDVGLTTHVTIAVDTLGAVRAYRGTTAGTLLGQTANGQFTLNTYAVWRVLVVLSDTVGSVLIYKDGAEVLNLPGIDTKNAGTATVFDQWELAIPNGIAITFDDVIAYDGIDGVITMPLIGSVRSKVANANGASSQWTGSDGNQVDNFLLIDEAPDPILTDYIDALTAGLLDLVAMENESAPGSVLAIITHAYAKNAGDGAISLEPGVRSGGSNFFGAPQVLPTATEADVAELWRLDPATGLAWSLTAANAVETGNRTA